MEYSPASETNATCPADMLEQLPLSTQDGVLSESVSMRKCSKKDLQRCIGESIANMATIFDIFVIWSREPEERRE